MANENQIEVWAQLKVSAGQGEAFRAIAGQMIEAVDTQEPGCTRYHWFLTDGDSECSVSELYDDSAALLAHFRGTAIVDLAPNLFTVAELTRLEVHGSPSPEAAEAVAAFGTAILKAFSGLNR